MIAREENAAGKDKASKSNDDDTLRQEILALGGTEEDLDLIADAESEDEVADANTSKKSGKSDDDALRKELSGMLAAAGQVVPEDLKDDEVEEEEEEEEEEEKDGDGDDESDEQEQAEEEESDAEEDAISEPLKETRKEPVKSDEFVVPKEFASLVRVLNPDQLLGVVETNIKTGYSSKVRLVRDISPSDQSCETSDYTSPLCGRAITRTCLVAAREGYKDVQCSATSFSILIPQVLLDHHGLRYPQRQDLCPHTGRPRISGA